MMQIDKQNMIKLLRDFPTQLEQANLLKKEINLPKTWKNTKFENIVIQGMGGSGIGGLLLKDYLTKELKIPIFVNQNYSLPGFVSSKTLFFAVSYSGNTEEVLTGLKEAKKRKCKIFIITSGGKLGKEKKPKVIISNGLPPRTQIGMTFIPAIFVLEKIGLIKKSTEINKTIKFINKNNKLFETKGKMLAEKLYKKIPIIYSAENIGSTAVRFHTQISENSKQFSHHAFLPEMNHNELVGFTPFEKQLIFVLFRDKSENNQMKKRFNVVKKITKKKSKIVEIESIGKTFIERLLSLFLIGDYASYYLALKNKINPWPVKNIDFLKKELNK